MTNPLIAIPCTARELEDALHRVCDQGLWDAKVRVVLVKPQGYYYLQFYDIETKEETK